IAQIYRGRTRVERHEELVAYAVAGGIQQARVAHERSNGEGRIHMNVLWEMAAAERVLNGVLEGAKGLIHGVTCGAGMPYRLAETQIFMAGGVWCLREWTDWIGNPELGPVAFQFGTRPLLTQESPISDAWKRKLLTLGEGDISLNHFSPTGFYSSAVRNRFLN